jgi:hypothetical protein
LSTLTKSDEAQLQTPAGVAKHTGRIIQLGGFKNPISILTQWILLYRLLQTMEITFLLHKLCSVNDVTEGIYPGRQPQHHILNSRTRPNVLISGVNIPQKMLNLDFQ